MATIDTPESTDVDVETLMRLIQRRVQGLPDARYIMGEIEKARLKAEGIATGRFGEAAPPLEVEVEAESDAASSRRRGWKNGVKGQVATLIIRAVRRNFRLQEIFNNSVVGVLQLMAEDLYAHEKRIDVRAAGAFDHAGFEQVHLDPKPFCTRSLSLFREMLREEDVALLPFCGRGEVLATFTEHGIETVGVDPDTTMVQVCRERGLNARHEDIFKHLTDAPDSSYGGIFAWRVVERLTNDQTAEFVKLARRKLRRGGIFVGSATNIDHLPSMSSFYMDPRLVRPVPAKLLAFMVESSGLGIHHFTYSGDQEEELTVKVLGNEVYPYNEYTIVAVND